MASTETLPLGAPNDLDMRRKTRPNTCAGCTCAIVRSAHAVIADPRLDWGMASNPDLSNAVALYRNGGLSAALRVKD